MKKILTGLTFSLFFSHLIAQPLPLEVENAARFSTTGLFGTASYVGKGGAIGALGADVMSASTNPAGLGLYQKSDCSFTPMFKWTTTESNFLGTKAVEHTGNLKFNSFGMVFNFNMDEENGTEYLKSWQLSFAWNRLNEFKNNTLLQGTSASSWVRDEWVNWANDEGSLNQLNEFDTRLAYNTRLLELVSGSTDQYYTPIGTGPLWKQRLNSELGGTDEINISISGNISHFLYLGASLGIPDIYYLREATYIEKDLHPDGTVSDFKEYTYRQTTEIDGKGINLKLGLIVRPQDWLRFGFAYHTPTYYSFDDSYSTSLQTELSFSSMRDNSTTSTDEYSLMTPGKFIGSVAFVYGDHSSKIAGTLSADVEYMDYSNLLYSANNTSFFSNINNLIEENYTSTFNLHLGGNVNFENTVFRAGYALFGSPYKSKDILSNQQAVSFGIGYRSKWNYIDFSYVYSWYNAEMGMYTSSLNLPLAQLKTNKNMFILTYGVRF